MGPCAGGALSRWGLAPMEPCADGTLRRWGLGPMGPWAELGHELGITRHIDWGTDRAVHRCGCALLELLIDGAVHRCSCLPTGLRADVAARRWGFVLMRMLADGDNQAGRSCRGGPSWRAESRAPSCGGRVETVMSRGQNREADPKMRGGRAGGVRFGRADPWGADPRRSKGGSAEGIGLRWPVHSGRSIVAGP